MDKPYGRSVSYSCMKRSGVHGKSLHQVSASRRDASVVDAKFRNTESFLRDSIIMYHAYSVLFPHTHKIIPKGGNTFGIILLETQFYFRIPDEAEPTSEGSLLRLTFLPKPIV